MKTMYSKRQLDQLSEEIGKATRKFHKAVADNLKKIGKPVKVQGDDEEVKGIELTIEEEGGLYDYVFDLVKWDGKYENVQVHYTSFHYKDADEWMDISYLGDDEDYLLEAIQWPEVEKEENMQNVFPIITLDREDLKEHLSVKDAEAVDDATMACIADKMSEWFLYDFSETLYNAAKSCHVI